MTRPGGPQHYPQQGWQQPAQQGWQQQPHPQHHHPQWAPSPPPRKKKNRVVIWVLITLLVAGLTAGGFWLYEELDDPPALPPVDSSQDLAEAPIGCAMLEEAEVAPYIPGRMDYEAGSANSGTRAHHDQGQCNWGNTGTFTEDGVRGAFLIVTSYVYHADQRVSGVDKAVEHMTERIPAGVEVNVPDADDAQLSQTDDTSATVTVRYRNVVYDVNYHNQTEGANVKGGATELATVALGKVVPGD